MRTDFVWVVPRKIDGSLTRSISGGRGFLGGWSFEEDWVEGVGVFGMVGLRRIGLGRIEGIWEKVIKMLLRLLFYE
jgi:hypothetical protein